MSKDIAIRQDHGNVPAVSEAWHNFRQEIDRLFNRFSNNFDSFALEPFSEIERLMSRPWGGFAPLAVDVAENDTSYTITAELPGVDEKNVEVSVNDDTLVIKGEKRQEREEKGKHRYVSERSYGSFQRMFGLPRGTDATQVQAKFHNGVLTVTLPKPAQTQNVRKVEVKAA